MNSYVGAALEAEGFYWMPYNSNYNTIYQVQQGAVDPANYLWNNTSVYMLIRSSSAAAMNQGGISSGTIISTTSQQETQQSQNIQQSTLLYQVESNVSKTLSDIGKSINTDVSSTSQTLNTDFLILGIASIIVIGGIVFLKV